MDRWHYLLILAACLAVTLPLEALLGVRVLRRPGRLVAAVLPVLVVFAGWDLIAHSRGHWWFGGEYTLGYRLAGLPLEEWLFFLVVPVCAIVAYEAVSSVLDRRRQAAGRSTAALAPARAPAPTRAPVPEPGSDA